LIGELALRVHDLGAMTAFYRDVVGLEIFNDDFDEFVFFKVGDLAEGHPQILGLFDRHAEVSQSATTLDHFAFVIDLADYQTQRERLEGLGLTVFPREFPRFGWRSMFFNDPEGNTLEFVCYDPSVSGDTASPGTG
jgi:extradiol dioxygenase family protein